MHIPGCGSTAYSLFYLGSKLILADISNPVGRVSISYDIAGPCPAEPLQLVPAQLSLSPAGPYQMRCTSLRIATEMRPVRNMTNACSPRLSSMSLVGLLTFALHRRYPAQRVPDS